MSLGRFLGEVKKAGFTLSKPYLFEVTLMNTQSGDEQMLRFLCHEANLPNWGVETTTNRIYGYNVEMPTNYQMGEVTLAFYADRELGIMKMFEEMKKKMFNETNYSLKYRDSYSFSTTITIFDVDNMSPVASYLLEECFLKSVQPGRYNWASIDTLQTINVEIAYDHFTSQFHKLASHPNKPSAKGFLDKILDNSFFRGTAIDNIRKTVNDATGMFNKLPPMNFETVQRLAPESLDGFKVSTNDSYMPPDP